MAQGGAEAGKSTLTSEYGGINGSCHESCGSPSIISLNSKDGSKTFITAKFVCDGAKIASMGFV